MFSPSSKNHLVEEESLPNKDKKYQFFIQKLEQLDRLYVFTKKDKNQLWKAFSKNSMRCSLDKSWVRIWSKYAKENRVTLSARYTLKRCANKGDDLAKYFSAEYELSQELKKSLKAADAYFLFDEALLTEQQVQKLDKSLLKYFEQHVCGLQSKAIAKALSVSLSKESYDKRLLRWQDPLYFCKLIANCRWLDQTRLLVESTENKAPALAEPIHNQLLNIQTRGSRLNEEGNSIVDIKGNKIINFNLAACIGFETVNSLFLSSIPLLSSTTAYYVITWLLQEVHRQHLLGRRKPRRIVLKGRAYERLGELCGAGSHPNVINKIRRIIPALSGCLFKYRTTDRIGEGNFLSYRYEKATNGKYSVLMIEIQELACPGFTKSLPKGGVEFQEQRRAVPVTRPFPFYGKQTKSFSLQLRFQYALVQEMRQRAKEIYRCNGILLDDELITELALEAQLPKKSVEPMIDFWVKEEYLYRSNDGLYSLGNKVSAAQKMIKEAGKYEFEGAAAAKRKLANKRKRIAAKAR